MERHGCGIRLAIFMANKIEAVGRWLSAVVRLG
jgi:hypothetical protein